jgi:hypothetical protein
MEIPALLIWLFLLTAVGFAVILGLLWLHQKMARKDHKVIKTKAENKWR